MSQLRRKLLDPVSPWAAMVLCGLLLAAAGASAQVAVPDTPCKWTEMANGLTRLAGRICLSRVRVLAGTPIIVATLTLRNEESPVMSVAWRDEVMRYFIVDADGKDVTAAFIGGVPRSGNISKPYDFGSGPPPLILPPHGEVSFEIPGGGGIPRNKAAVLQLGTLETNIMFEPTDRPLFLRAVLDIPRTGARVQGEWSGRLVFADVQIPIGLEPASPAKFAATLAEAETLIATGQPGKAAVAVDRLSLLNDLRVVPLYMKAFGMADSTITFSVIDNLRTLLRNFPDGDLDQLFAGFSRAARIGPADVRASTEQGAAQSAAQHRRAVVMALAESKDPRARKLLKTMESDPDQNIGTLARQYLAE